MLQELTVNPQKGMDSCETLYSPLSVFFGVGPSTKGRFERQQQLLAQCGGAMRKAGKRGEVMQQLLD